MTEAELLKIFRAAAERALADWHPEQWDRQRDEAEDLSQDLWVWYLETPSTQRKMANLEEHEAVETARIHATQLLSKQALSGNTFQGRDLYSSDAVKEALRGDSTNKYLREVLPYALDNLAVRNETQAEAVRVRYSDEGHPDKDVLSRAVRSVTEEVNVFYLTSDHDCIGSSASVFPETRKRRGEHSDPTGNTAMALDQCPEFRYHFFEDTPIREFLGGAGTQPAFALGKIGAKTVRFRRTGSGVC